MLKIPFYFGLVLLVFCACGPDQSRAQKKPKIQEATTEIIQVDPMNQEVLDRYASIGLVKVTDERFIIELPYASTNNFTKQQLYDTINGLFLQKEVSERLSRCQDLLDSLRPGYRIKIFDGVRPLQTQQEMWDALDTMSVWLRGKFVSNPRQGSIHNFGTAVDVTICDAQGRELDMGAGYDDFRPIAYPSREAEFLRKGELKPFQVENRQLLRQVMRSQKFTHISTEWWHFNAFGRRTSEYKFEILLNESGGHRKWYSPAYSKPIAVDSLSSSGVTDN